MVFGKQQLRGIADLTQSRLLHLVDAQLAGASKAVLDAAQNAVHIVLVTLELDNRINDVLQDFRSCQRALLGDVSDEDDGYAARLGKTEQGSGTLTNLGDAAGTALHILGRNGLDGVDDHQLGLYFLDVFEDGFQRVLAENKEIVVFVPFHNAFCPHLQLVGAFLTAHVEHTLVSQAKHSLQRKRRFADAGLTAQQYDATRNQSAA